MFRKLKAQGLSLRQRVLLLTMITTGVGLILGSAGYLVYDLRTARDQKLAQLELTADLISTNAVASLEFDDVATAKEYLGALKARSGFRGGVIYNASGEILATYDAPDSVPFSPPPRGEDGASWE